jgi:4-hydroxy-tetrahydrodipicolinate synthase
MVRYNKDEAREWARETMRGLCNVVIPSYTLDLKRLNEKGIRHDIRKEIEMGFWGTLLVSETAITFDEYRQFVQWSRDEARDKVLLVHHALFNTLEENIEAVQMAEQEGCELVLLGYPSNFYATSSDQIFDYTKRFCDATQLGVIIFPVPHWISSALILKFAVTLVVGRIASSRLSTPQSPQPTGPTLRRRRCARSLRAPSFSQSRASTPRST